MRSRHLTLVMVALLLTACAPDVQVSEQGGLGSSGLAPSIAAEKSHRAHGGRHRAKAGRAERVERAHKPRRPSPRPTSRPVAATATPADAPTPQARPSTLSAAITDPAGDVRGSLAGAPSYVDLTGARLTRSARGFELRVRFEGVVPTAQGSDGRTVNVASFYDVDGDGQVDYEVWASLADDGWSASYRYPDGARYGGDSGVAARPDGADLVLTFPLGHLRGADAFRWSVGAEWGSYDQVAAGTTARDTAPDSGVTRFPG